MGSLLAGAAGGAGVAITIKAIDSFSSVIDKATGKFGALSSTLKIGSVAILGFGAALTAIGVSSVKVAADFQQTQVAFTTMLGNAEKAQSLLKNLADFAKKTPFTLTGVEKSAKQLLAVGFEADSIIPTLKSVGDVVAGLGLGEDGLERIILNLGQVRAQGKLTGRELRDFTTAGIPLIAQLAKQFGVSESAISDMVSSGMIKTADVIKAFDNMSGAGGKFENLMGKQAETVKGKFSNLKDTFEQFQRTIGTALLPVVSQLADLFQNQILPAIAPLLPLLGTALAGILTTLSPLIQLFSGAILKLAEYFSKELLPAIQPHIPAFTNLIGLLLQAGGEIMAVLMPALLALLPTFLELATSLANQLIPVIQSLMPIVLMLLPMFMQLADIFVNQLLPAVLPFIPVFAQLGIMLLQIGMQVLNALMPAVLALLPVFLALLTVLMPLIPPLGDLIIKVSELALPLANLLIPAINALIPLLVLIVPPLVIIIGWITKLIDLVIQLVSWLGKISFGVFEKVGNLFGGGKTTNTVKTASKKNDFIMRPGQGAVPFSSQDTIVGFKGKSMGGGTIININVQGSLIKQSDLIDSVGKAMQRELSSLIKY